MSTAKFGPERAEHWSDEAYADPVRYLAHRAELIRLLGPPLEPGDTVVDFACGDGRLAEFLVPYELTYLGVDASPSMVAAARTRLAGLAKVELGDIDEYRPSAPVAATTVFRALYYARDRGAFLRRVAEFTEKKIVFDLNPRRYSLDEIRSELRAAGWSSVCLRPFFVPQTVRLPALLARALVTAEHNGPLSRALLRVRFTYVCAAARS